MSDERRKLAMGMYMSEREKWMSGIGIKNLWEVQVDAMLAFADEESEEKDAEIARLREDAERYRWLRPRLDGFDVDICKNGLGVVFRFPENTRVGVGDSLDAAIDAARKDTK